MKVDSLVVLLRNFENLVEGLGCSATLEDLREFRGLFAGYENDTLAKFVGKLENGKEAPPKAVASEPILRLAGALTKFQVLLVSANAKDAGKDIGQLVSLLDGCNHVSVAQYVEDAKRWAKPLTPAQLVQKYTAALTGTSNDNAAFDQVAAKLDADKKIRKREMREIARNYLGYDLAKKKGRADALQEIIDRQALNARQEARTRSHERLKSW